MRLAWAFIALGVLVRSIRFLLDFPLWPDEAYLAHNYLDRGYLELLQALDYRQVAPLLYLWVQKTFVMICGFSEYSLRLYVFLGSLASLLLFRDLASRLLQGMTRLIGDWLLFAVAYPLIRYSAEAKPYGSDMLVSLVLLVLLVRLARQPRADSLALGPGHRHAAGRDALPIRRCSLCRLSAWRWSSNCSAAVAGGSGWHGWA